MIEFLKYLSFGLLWLSACLWIIYIIKSKKIQANFEWGLKLILFSFLIGAGFLIFILFTSM